MRKLLVGSGVALTVVLFLASGVSFAGCDLTFYADQGLFQIAAAGDGIDLTLEDFGCNGDDVPGPCVGITTPPVGASTNDGCFDGCLSPGWELTTSPSGEYLVVQAGFLGAPVPMIGPNLLNPASDDETVTWNFSPSVSAAGFRVHGDIVGPVEVS